MVKPLIALICLSVLGACAASNTQYVTADVAQPVAGSPNVPVPGAQPTTSTLSGPEIFNSDNRPVQTRSGLNSDPTNPSGAPGRVFSSTYQ